MVRQNALTLWLPVTIRQYPNIYVDLLNQCLESTPEGWLTRMAILKVARACGNDQILDISLRISVKNEGVDNVASVPVSSLLGYAVSHIDETVRSEALAFLCHTKKASHPVTQEEATLIKEFFSLNMNIDSAPFRQNIIRCYKALVVRLRDACTGILKNPPYSKTPIKGNVSAFTLKDIKENSILFINGELLLWFLLRFHSNLQPGCNYQRRILSLQLYKETLLAFFELKDGSKYMFNQRFSNVCAVVDTLSAHGNGLQKGTLNSQAVCNLTLPWTREMLLWCCLDEMDDVRNESETILKILEFSGLKLSKCCHAKWFRVGLSLCNSPKSSDVESGASIIKIMACSQDSDLKFLLKVGVKLF